MNQSTPFDVEIMSHMPGSLGQGKREPLGDDGHPILLLSGPSPMCRAMVCALIVYNDRNDEKNVSAITRTNAWCERTSSTPRNTRFDQYLILQFRTEWL